MIRKSVHRVKLYVARAFDESMTVGNDVNKSAVRAYFKQDLQLHKTW